MLYNAPRAASIFAKSSDCVLWALDRDTFSNIVKESAIRKREKYEKFLKSVDILKPLQDYEIGQVCDAVKSEFIQKDEYIIRQFEVGNKFYILEQGKASALKQFPDGVIKPVLEYKEGSYFGELALLNNEPRAASVKAKTDCKILSLDSNSFKRLLGPLEEILKRQSEVYNKYMHK